MWPSPRPSQFFRATQRLEEDKDALGDYAVLILDALGMPFTPATERRLRHVEARLPPVDLDHLRSLPEGTLGNAFVHHLDDHQIPMLVISPELDEEVQRNHAAVRYLMMHDILHALLGFDATRAGEMGVLAFAVAQGYSVVQGLTLGLGSLYYPFRYPQMQPQMWWDTQRGLLMGTLSDFLLDKPLYEHFEEPVSNVRRAYGVPVGL